MHILEVILNFFWRLWNWVRRGEIEREREKNLTPTCISDSNESKKNLTFYMKNNLRILLQFGFIEIRQAGSLWSQNSVESLENTLLFSSGCRNRSRLQVVIHFYKNNFVTLSSPAWDRERIPGKDTSHEKFRILLNLLRFMSYQGI